MLKNDENKEEKSRKLFTPNIKLKRELGINAHEGIIRNNFCLISFACCPREIRFSFTFMNISSCNEYTQTTIVLILMSFSQFSTRKLRKLK